MAKQAIRDGKIVYYFDNFPEEIKLNLQNSKETLSFIPSYFKIIHSNASNNVIITEKADSVSLMV